MLLSVDQLRKVYRDGRRGEVTAVDGISFAVQRGELVGLLGSNGAGKTTLLKCICTLIRPTSGELRVDGVDAVANPRAAVSRLAAVLEGNRNLYWHLTPLENLRFFAGLHGISARAVRARADELLAAFGLTGKAATPAMRLSRGMQQKLALACALVRPAALLLLDEPTLGLDVQTSHELRRVLRELAEREGRTILLSSHDMAVVQDTCTRVVVVSRGRVVTDDRVENLLALFRATSYTVVLGSGLSKVQETELRSRFEHLKLADGGAATQMEVDLADSGGVYELVEILRGGNTPITSISQKVPNLEEVYLSLVRGQP
jgi:ABC-2 type transport system ATP-binding protein